MGIFSKLIGKEDNPLHDAIKMVHRLIEDEEYQNSLLPDAMKVMIRKSVDCDIVPDAGGEFGMDVINPIPVNGAIGEIAYLSKLETTKGERLLFHRFGSINMVDVFEAVTFSGSEWFIFFLDLYHPRKSRKAPARFKFGDGVRQFSGFHKYCPNFPYDFQEQKASERESGLSMAYIALSQVMGQIEKRVFQPPLAHTAKLSMIRRQLSSIMTGH